MYYTYKKHISVTAIGRTQLCLSGKKVSTVFSATGYVINTYFVKELVSHLSRIDVININHDYTYVLENIKYLFSAFQILIKINAQKIFAL